MFERQCGKRLSYVIYSTFWFLNMYDKGLKVKKRRCDSYFLDSLPSQMFDGRSAFLPSITLPVSLFIKLWGFRQVGFEMGLGLWL